MNFIESSFLKGTQLLREKEKNLVLEAVKLEFAVLLLTTSLASLILVPHFLQGHTWSQFLEGLKEGKWALIAGAAAGVGLTFIGSLYIWQKNREDLNKYTQQILKLDKIHSKELSQKLQSRYKHLSVVIATVALGLFATALLVAKYENLISKVSLTDLSLAGATAVAICSLTYMIFKSHEIHQIRGIREKCLNVQNIDEDETPNKLKEIYRLANSFNLAQSGKDNSHKR